MSKKSFEGFKEYVRENGAIIHQSIHERVLNAVNSQQFEDVGEEHEFYRRAWVELGIMETLEHYHNWLHRDE